eukprot:6315505-Alexandrium_andersonii.AAC.1
MHERFSDTFGSPGAVFLVTLARLDHEGALELALLLDEQEEQMCGVTCGHDLWFSADLITESSHTWSGKFWMALVRSMYGHSIPFVDPT